MPKNIIDPLRLKKRNMRVLTEVKEQYQNRNIASFIIDPTDIVRKNRENTFRINSKKNMASSKNIRLAGRKQGCLVSISASNTCNRQDIVKDQILNSIKVSWLAKKFDQETYNIEVDKLVDKLTKCFNACEEMLDNLYSYKEIEKYVKFVSEITRNFYSTSLQFYVYCHIAFLLYIYESYSLTLYYLDRALKIYSNKKKYRFERKLQISAFHYSSKIFTEQQQFQKGKDLAYMFLRKAWLYGDTEEQLSAYDLLGQIEMEIGNVELSKYFHHRMCKGIVESKQTNQKIMNMSNNQLWRQFNEKLEFYVGENINCFADRDKQIIQIIEKHFKSQAQQHSNQYSRGKYRMIYTHRSPNRNFKNYRLLERGMIQPKQSLEIHFVKPRNLRNIRKIVNELSGFFFALKRELLYEKKYHKYYEDIDQNSLIKQA